MRFAILLCILLVLTKVHAKKCTALVLEGGGDKGAYQAGAIRGLYEAAGNESTYDVLSGVSIGAINAVAYSLIEAGHEDKATKFLRKHSKLTLAILNFLLYY